MNKKYERDEDGLLKCVDYARNEDGSIDWKSMVPADQVYPNKDYFLRNGKPIPESTEGLEDHELCIKLGGIKKIAKLRGFSLNQKKVVYSSDSSAVAECRIVWIANFEEPYEVDCLDSASANSLNTNGFEKKYLESIACNRAFVRTVRNHLGIDIVGFDELSGSGFNGESGISDLASATSPLNTLFKVTGLSEGNFGDFLEILRNLYKINSYRNEETKKWKTWTDIPNTEIAKIIKSIRSNGKR